MKKTAIALAVAFASITSIAAYAAPQDNSWYLGAKVGWSHYNDTDSNFSIRGNKDLDDKDQFGAGAFAGYQHNQYLGFELGYDWLGRMKSSGHSRTKHTDLRASNKYYAQGVQLAAKLSYPVMQDLDIYTRLGGFVWRAEVNGKHKYRDRDHLARRDNDDRRERKRGKHTDYGVSPLAAAGIEYAWNENWATRLDYQYVWNIGERDTIGMRPDNGLLSLGVVYRFGREHVPAPAPEVAPAPVETKRFTLKSDVLFNFNKSTLKIEGHQALDQLYEQLSSLHPSEGSIMVVGYTDRIGSEHYNLRLSEDRARSVVNYLIGKGIPAERISARGMGKADPVTGSSCHGIKHRATLINCLAPDRRVEIEVDGVNETSAAE